MWVAPHLPDPPNEFFSIEMRGVAGRSVLAELYVHEHERFARACSEPLENPPVLPEGQTLLSFLFRRHGREVQLRSEIFPQFLRRFLTRDDAAVLQKQADHLQSAVSDNGTKLRP